MLLYAIGDAFRTGVHKAMIFQYLKTNGWADQKVNYYGHTRSWSQVGSAFSALIAGVIVFFGGAISEVFLWSVIPYLFDVVLIASYPKWLDGEVKTHRLDTVKARFLEVWKSFVISLFFRILFSHQRLYPTHDQNHGAGRSCDFIFGRRPKNCLFGWNYLFWVVFAHSLSQSAFGKNYFTFQQ